jgi:LysR family transcriptional regulator, transcriptional activator of nhaA
MEWLNYHHLYYFWTVARAGSIARAGEELRLSQPTISNQLKALESALGQKLFERQGRRLVLTDVGRTALRYADDIFRTGRELQQAMKGLPTDGRLRLVVGVADVIPKRVATMLLEPAVKVVPRLELVCREAPLEQLMASLALHELDVVLADAPASEEVKVRAFDHPLVDCGVTFVAPPALAHLRKGFPRSLDGAPMLLPARGTALRRDLEAWFEAEALRPDPAGEFDDSALLEAFGARGMGFFAVPEIIEKEITHEHALTALGRIGDVRGRYYAISVERRLRHPAVAAIAAAARRHGGRAGRSAREGDT